MKRLAVGAIAGVLLGGCVTVNVTPPPEKLRPRVVLADAGAGTSRVALIEVRGLLVDSKSPGLLADGPNPVDRFVSQLEQIRADRRVKAVVVRITSPGGTVTASDIMHTELRRFREETGVPVVISMGEVAASGGYYLALAGDRLIAQPTTITGSIGVIVPSVNVSEGLAKIGIHSRSIVSGPNKDLANPFEPMHEGHYTVLQQLVDDFYDRFQGLVRERRPGIRTEDFAQVTDGRVMSGERAKALGLVDDVGGVRESFAAAKSMAGLKAAALVKYVGEGDLATSAYSRSTRDAGTEVNLVQVRLGDLRGWSGETGHFFYVWAMD